MNNEITSSSGVLRYYSLILTHSIVRQCCGWCSFIFSREISSKCGILGGVLSTSEAQILGDFIDFLGIWRFMVFGFISVLQKSCLVVVFLLMFFLDYCFFNSFLSLFLTFLQGNKHHFVLFNFFCNFLRIIFEISELACEFIDGFFIISLSLLE